MSIDPPSEAVAGALVCKTRTGTPNRDSGCCCDAALGRMVKNLALHYDSATAWIVSHCPAPDKFAHTYAGLLIWLIAALIVRRPQSIIPLSIVVIVELANECVDRVAHGSWMWTDTLGDMAATWFWPVMLTAALRWTPRRA